MDQARTPGWQAAFAERSRADRHRYNFHSLRIRLISLVLLVLVPAAGLFVLTAAEQRRTAVETVNQEALRVTQLLASNQTARIEGAQQLLKALALLSEVRGQDPVSCNTLLARLITADSRYLLFGVAEADGDVWCSALPVRQPLNLSDRRYFQKALETRGFGIGEYQVGRITGKASLNFGYPVLNSRGEVERVVFAAQDLTWLATAINLAWLPEGAVFVVTDRNGTVLASMPETLAWTGKPLPDPAVLHILSGQVQSGLLESTGDDGVLRLWAHAPLSPDAAVHASIGIPKQVALSEADAMLARNLGALGLVTLVALGAAWLAGQLFILNPVKELLATTSTIAKGDLSARAKIRGGHSELDRLAQAFNGMTATLEARETKIRAAEEAARKAEVELTASRTEMEIARQIQQALQPQALLVLEAAAVAGRCIPAVKVGGDGFGYRSRDGRNIDLFISDVSGHGVGAALLMSESRSILMGLLQEKQGVGQVMTSLNDALFDDLDHADLFMTAFCAKYDSDAHVLSFANAGHPQAIHLMAETATCELLDAEGLVLGVQPKVAFAEGRASIRAGDIVALYTDGIVETASESGELFGLERLRETIVSHREASPEEIIAAVLTALRHFHHLPSFEDDITLVVLKVLA
jgi:serine phosphatase RsbU (regulator of sigma subunit)